MGSFRYRYKNASLQQIDAYKGHLIELLNKVVEICNKHQVKYSLDCGTLLGFVRDNKIIDCDGDCDLYVLGETVTLDFYQDLIDHNIVVNKKGSQFVNWHDLSRSFEKGSSIVPSIIKIEDHSKAYFSISNPAYPSLDIFMFVPYGAERYCKFIRTYSVRHNRQIVDELTTLNMRYGTFNIPKNYDALLKCYYGDTWRIPDPTFHDETRDITKYGWYGACESSSTGNIKYNCRDHITSFNNDVAETWQKKLGLIDDNLNPILDILPYFSNDCPENLKHLFDQVRAINEHYIAISAFDRIHRAELVYDHIRKYAHCFTEKEKEQICKKFNYPLQ